MKSIFITGLGILSLIAFVSAQDYRAVGVTLHNTLRSKHKTPGVTQSQPINTSAQQWADYLAQNNLFQHSGGPYGENIFKAWGGSKDLSERVKDAINSWYGEISLYNFNNPGNQPGTGHFTQLVWKSSTQLGIGATLAADPKYGHSITVVAQYNPRGNIVTSDGKYYRENVLPL